MRTLKILLSSYAVKPHSGSEPGNGWNFFVNLQKRNDLEVWLVTELEFKDIIIEECQKLGIDYSKIFFCDIGEKGRKLCWKQGSWSFYFYYDQWQRKVLKLAKKLHHKNNFDICHHNNMCGFRELGYLYKIPDTKFIVGPVGGVGNANLRLIYINYGFKSFSIELIKKVLNYINYRLPKVRNAVNRSDFFISAYPETTRIFKKIYDVPMVSIPETLTPGFKIDTRAFENNYKNNKYMIIIAKNVPRKFIKFAIKVFQKSQTDHSLYIFGEDPENKLNNYKSDISQPTVGINYFGFINKNELQNVMVNSKALLFPSLHDANPGAIMESLSFGVPVICFDKWGASSLISDNLYKISEKNSYKIIQRDYINTIQVLCRKEVNINKRIEHGNKFREIYSWDSNLNKIEDIYKQVAIDI